MKNTNLLIHKNNSDSNSNLYEFLATNYDISNLAYKIFTEKNAYKSMYNLKKIINNNDSTSA